MEAKGWTLVTGGAGYLGSVLVHELLRSGRRARVLDSLVHGSVPSLLSAWSDGAFEFVNGDLRDGDVRRHALCDVSEVVHLAAIVGDPACARDPEAAREVNLEATTALADDARAAGVRHLVFASTCSNYGKMVEADAFATEEWELRPISVYAETKVAAELALLHRSDELFAVTCLRLATVYGSSPRMRFDLTVNEFVRDMLKGELVVYGQQFWRPYIHVVDAARAISVVLDNGPQKTAGAVFNIGNTSENYRKSDLVGLLKARIPRGSVRYVSKQEDPRDYQVSFEKAHQHLGFTTTRTVPDGIDELIALLTSGLLGDPYASVYRN